MISALRKGLSEKPPTIKMKFTGDALARAYSAKSLTLDLMLLKSGSKKLIINGGGKSIELAPLCVNFIKGVPAV